jgi:sugar phosphate isomerase/epimerase
MDNYPGRYFRLALTPDPFVYHINGTAAFIHHRALPYQLTKAAGYLMYPRLPKTFKNTYAFKVSAPSFIYPDDYVPNVQLLGPFLDEIELLCFESLPSSLPSPGTIHELESLAREFQFTYNVHLPSDLDPGNPERKERDNFVESILRVVELTLPLAPTAYILHLPYRQAQIGQICDRAWQLRISDCLRRLSEAGVPDHALCIETLDYPLEWIEQILQGLDLSICLDMGHLIVNHQNVETAYHRFAGRTRMIHLHGVSDGKDHLSLEVLNQNQLDEIFSVLKQFTGTVSLEVFSFNHLLNSLAVLEKNLR